MSAPINTSTAAGRVAWLMRKIWGGSQARMARDTGLSRAAVSNVLSGRRAPGRGFLLAIASHPLVNSKWLLEGKGEPLDLTDDAPMDFHLPIAVSPLIGPPKKCPKQLSGKMLSVSQKQHAPSRYVLIVDAIIAPMFPAEVGVLAGDALVVETDDSFWQAEGCNLAGRLCIVRFGSGAAGLAAIGHIDAKGNLHVVKDEGKRLNQKKDSKCQTFRRIVPEGSVGEPTHPVSTPTELQIVGIIVALHRDYFDPA